MMRAVRASGRMARICLSLRIEGCELCFHGFSITIIIFSFLLCLRLRLSHVVLLCCCSVVLLYHRPVLNILVCMNKRSCKVPAHDSIFKYRVTMVYSLFSS